MSEGVRRHPAASVALQPIVTDGGGRLQALFHVARLEYFVDLVGMPGAHTPA